MKKVMHEKGSVVITPSVLYYGTPVILLSSLNEDGSTNISPLSSSWALGDYLVLGIANSGKAIENLNRCPECVINVPNPSLWRHVERIASYTGRLEVPEWKQQIGFCYEKNKFDKAGLTPVEALKVQPYRIAECPIQIEGSVKDIHRPGDQDLFSSVTVEANTVHAHQEIVEDGSHIDVGKWSPLIYNFRHYYGLGPLLGKTFRA